MTNSAKDSVTTLNQTHTYRYGTHPGVYFTGITNFAHSFDLGGRQIVIKS